MKKTKFVLTSDIVKVEQEPELVAVPVEIRVPKIEETKLIKQNNDLEKVQLNLKISKDVKSAFQVYCFKNGTTMSDELEKMILSKISDI
jgi:hypothetical protein